MKKIIADVRHFDYLDWMIASVLIISIIVLILVIFFYEGSNDDNNSDGISNMNTTISVSQIVANCTPTIPL